MRWSARSTSSRRAPYLLPFDAAWKRAVGTDLEREWAAWAAALAAQAGAQGGLSVPAGLEPAAADVGGPALARDGRTLAWPVDGGVRVATLRGGALHDARTVPTQPAASSLTWLDDHTVVMAAVGRAPGRYESDLFALDTGSGAVRRLTSGAHAHFPRADGAGCVLYVRDVIPEGASLRRWCVDRPPAVVWSAPAGTHIVGLAVSAGGRVALSLYRPSGVDLALLGPDGCHLADRRMPPASWRRAGWARAGCSTRATAPGCSSSTGWMSEARPRPADDP